jgi:hypothetical protein
MFHIAGITLKKRRLYTTIAIPAFFLLGSALLASAQDDNAQTSKLYKLQAAYHRAATVRDPVNGDSREMITARLREVLSLFTADAVLYLTIGSAQFDGYYLRNGDPDDATTCPPPSGDPNNRGTLCTFYKYLSPAFQATNKLVALTPSYKELFNVRGNTAAVYFECHYFNVAIDPATQRPFWTAVSHASFNGLARKVDGRWLFSYANGAVPPVPIP